MRAFESFSFSLERNHNNLASQGDISLKGEVDKLLSGIGIDIPQIDIDPNGELHVFYEFRVEVDSPQHQLVTQKLDKLQINYGSAYFFNFTKEEINQSPLFRFSTITEYSDMRHPRDYGTEYVKRALCRVCGLHTWLQSSDLHLNTQVVRNNKIIVQRADIRGGGFILVSGEFASLLEEENISGYILRPVVHIGESKMKEVYQLEPTNVLTELSPKMRYELFKGEYCPACGISGRCAWPLHYSPAVLTGLADFNLSTELFAYGVSAEPALLISPRLRKMLLGLKVKSRFEPVMVV